MDIVGWGLGLELSTMMTTAKLTLGFKGPLCRMLQILSEMGNIFHNKLMKFMNNYL